MLANLASSRLKRGLLVTAAFAVVALLALGGLPVLRQLYAAGWVAPEHYHVAFAALCILPAAAVHVAATLAGAHWTFWWSVWLPGVVVYAAFPWQGADGWRPLWIFGHAWDWGRTIFLHWEAAGPFVFNSFGSFVTMLTVTVVAFGRLWAGAATAIASAERRSPFAAKSVAIRPPTSHDQACSSASGGSGQPPRSTGAPCRSLNSTCSSSAVKSTATSTGSPSGGGAPSSVVSSAIPATLRRGEALRQPAAPRSRGRA